jgi:hypothetical protein
MACFKILRGPVGKGKSKIGENLAKESEGSFLLDLDLNANYPIDGLHQASVHKNVGAKLYHGNSHTTDPKWIKVFQERGYTLLSVILNACLETQVRRLMRRPDNRNKDDIEHQFFDFLMPEQE